MTPENFSQLPSPDVYYTGQYWNDDEQVQKYLNLNATGDEAESWFQYIAEHFRADKALILNCGNGWVERNLYDLGVFQNAVGIDVSTSLIQQAESEKGKRNIEYRVIDVNNFDVERESYDLIINHAALHHVTYIEFVVHQCFNGLRDDGYLISWDYFGPHRNQYPLQLWQELIKVNATLPSETKQDLIYPHLSTMLKSDPTEAVHSELIVEILDFYFDHSVKKALGGAIAYPILTHNSKFFALEKNKRDKYSREILEYDANYTNQDFEKTFFGFLVSKPKHRRDINPAEVESRLLTERIREESAFKNGGRYYPITFIENLTNEISDLKLFLQHKDIELEVLRSQDSLWFFALRRLRKFLRNFRQKGFHIE
jgi:SAM-dependent methyltransferase